MPLHARRPSTIRYSGRLSQQAQLPGHNALEINMPAVGPAGHTRARLSRGRRPAQIPLRHLCKRVLGDLAEVAMVPLACLVPAEPVLAGKAVPQVRSCFLQRGGHGFHGPAWSHHSVTLHMLHPPRCSSARPAATAASSHNVVCHPRQARRASFSSLSIEFSFLGLTEIDLWRLSMGFRPLARAAF